MRDILRWVLHWLSSGEAITPPHVVTDVVMLRTAAAGDVSIRATGTRAVKIRLVATDEVEL